MSKFAASVRERMDREVLDRVREAKVFRYATDLHIYQNQRYSPADGYVHPSSLDWSAKPETQAKKLLNKRRQDAPLLKTFRLGDIIHDDIGSLLDECFFDKCYPEKHIEISKILFRGTPDLLGYHRVLGNVLVEFKSISRYQKDRKFGDKWFNKIVKLLQGTGDYDNIPDEVLAEVYERLCTGEVSLTQAKPEHQTQVWTYAWVLSLLRKRIDWVCVCYVRKDNYLLSEFWFNVAENQHLIEKAAQNYKAVYKLIREQGKHLRG